MRPVNMSLYQDVVAEPARGAVRELAQCEIPRVEPFEARRAETSRRDVRMHEVHVTRIERGPVQARPSLDHQGTDAAFAERGQRGCEIRLCCDDPSAARGQRCGDIRRGRARLMRY